MRVALSCSTNKVRAEEIDKVKINQDLEFGVGLLILKLRLNLNDAI